MRMYKHRTRSGSLPNVVCHGMFGFTGISWVGAESRGRAPLKSAFKTGGLVRALILWRQNNTTHQNHPINPWKGAFPCYATKWYLIETSACCIFILPCDVVYWTVLVSSGILGWLKLSNCFLPVIITILEHLIDIYSYMFATLVWVYWLVNGK